MWHAVQPERSVPVALEGTEHHFRQVERHSIVIFRGKRFVPEALRQAGAQGHLHDDYFDPMTPDEVWPASIFASTT
jgi:hypothetical protein